MNEKFKLLALEAQMGTADFDAGSYYVATPDRMQKLCELIVQECIDIIAPYSVRMSRPGEEYLHPIQEIKQHFGVEL
jgi:hypothetical protein